MDVHKRILLSCAVRYALGRKSYVVGAVAEELEKAWDDLPSGQQERYHKEIREAIDKDRAGMDCDVRRWERILELPIKERETR